MGWFCTLLIVGSDLHHGSGPVGAAAAGAIRSLHPGIRGEDVGAAVFAAEDGTLGEGCQSVEGGGAVAPNHRIGQDPVVEGHIDAVMISVECHRLYINVGIDQIGTANPGSGTGIENALGAFGQIDPKIFDTVLIPTAVGDFTGVNGQSFA